MDMTIKEAYPLPSIDGIPSRVDEIYYIPSVDLKFAIWRIKFDPKSKEWTAFTVPGWLPYQFRVMPCGLCKAVRR